MQQWCDKELMGCAHTATFVSFNNINIILILMQSTTKKQNFDRTDAASTSLTSHLSRLYSNTNFVWHYTNRIFLLHSHNTTLSLLSHFAYLAFTLHSHSSSFSVLLLTCCHHLIDLPMYLSHFRHLHCSIFFLI